MIGIFFATPLLTAQLTETPGYKRFPFGKNGQLNTTYDSRQRPNCMLVDGILFLVPNGDGKKEESREYNPLYYNRQVSHDANSLNTLVTYKLSVE